MTDIEERSDKNAEPEKINLLPAGINTGSVAILSVILLLGFLGAKLYMWGYENGAADREAELDNPKNGSLVIQFNENMQDAITKGLVSPGELKAVMQESAGAFTNQRREEAFQSEPGLPDPCIINYKLPMCS